MEDITKEMNTYRECVRNIWNVYFLRQLTPENEFSIKDEFDRISTKIFSALILNRIGRASYKKSTMNQSKLKPLFFLTVVPLSDSEVPIYINRKKGNDEREYWDYPIGLIKSGDVDMRFVDFYDYGQYGFRDFEYYLINIKNSSVNSDLQGRNALIKTIYARVFFDDKQIEEAQRN